MCHTFHFFCFQYGDYDDNIHKKGFLINEQLLPKRVSMFIGPIEWKSCVIRLVCQFVPQSVMAVRLYENVFNAFLVLDIFI